MDAFSRPANAEVVATAVEDGGRGSGEESAVSLWSLNLGCVAYFARRARWAGRADFSKLVLRPIGMRVCVGRWGGGGGGGGGR